jgi:cysteine desulfurase
MPPATIYLDNSATTAIAPEVRDEMMPFLTEKWGNPSSIHKHGRNARAAVEQARERVAKLLNCREDEVYFSPCATYSNNEVILGAAAAQTEKKHLITSNIEHPSCLGPAKFLEANGWKVTFLPVNHEGLISIDQLKRAVTDQTSIISLMWANNEIGSLQPVVEIGQFAAERKILFHTDAVQVPGKLDINVAALHASTLSLSGHKFFAPKGIGVLYVRKGVELKPVMFGGGQEHGFFPGTEPVANIVAIGKAAELAKIELDSTRDNLRKMQGLLMERFKALPQIKMTGPLDLEKRLPGHVSFVVSGLEGEAAVMQCDLKGLFISSASACKKGIMQPSHVVSALGVSDECAIGSLRVTAGRFNTIEECERAAQIITKVVTAKHSTLAAK